MLASRNKFSIDILVVLLFSVSLLLLSGCSSSKTKQGSPFIGGTNGLLVDFVQGAPPETIFDSGESPFQVIVHLENDGEFTIPKDKVRVTLLGFNPADFGLSSSDIVKHPDEDLAGVTKDLSGQKRNGGQVDVTFPNFNYNAQVSNEVSYPFIAEVCYYYETRAHSNICVKRNLLSQNTDYICKVNEQKTVYSSGAPIQVTSLKESAAGNNKVSFDFTIEQKGNGDVYKKDTDCGAGTPFGKEGKVYVEVNTGLQGLKCNGLLGGDTAGFVTLASGKKTVIECVQSLNDLQSDFPQPIDITLGYDFKNVRSKNILVRPSQ